MTATVPLAGWAPATAIELLNDNVERLEHSIERHRKAIRDLEGEMAERYGRLNEDESLLLSLQTARKRLGYVVPSS